MRATVLLPLPLSPTSAVTVPGRSVNVTSSTACKRPRPTRPLPAAKCFVSPRTSIGPEIEVSSLLLHEMACHPVARPDLV